MKNKRKRKGATVEVEGRDPATPLTLEQLRAEIDGVDARIHELLNDRARLARQAGISKHADGHTVDFYRPNEMPA